MTSNKELADRLEQHANALDYTVSKATTLKKPETFVTLSLLLREAVEALRQPLETTLAEQLWQREEAMASCPHCCNFEYRAAAMKEAHPTHQAGG